MRGFNDMVTGRVGSSDTGTASVPLCLRPKAVKCAHFLGLINSLCVCVCVCVCVRAIRVAQPAASGLAGKNNNNNDLIPV